jgi:GNAT superfamily N-acetyltransferase
MVFRSEHLEIDRHDVGALDSGASELDTWFREQAAGAEARRVARTFVWVESQRPDQVRGYYTLTGHRLVRSALPASVGHGSPAEIPAVLLARLALDVSLQGTGMGGVLLADALMRIVTATRTVAARFVVVDDRDEVVAAFYEHYGFRRIPDSMRLVQKVSDIASAMPSP